MKSPVRTVWRVSLTIALILAVGIGLNVDSYAKSKADWFAAWGFSQQGLAPETVTDGTVRMIARPTLAGNFVRVQLQNTFATTPLTIGAAAIGIRVNGALLAPGSNRPLTFGGSASVTIPAGGAAYSDPLPFTVHAWQDVAVSLYIPGAAVPISRHTNARTTSLWTLPGAEENSYRANGTAHVRNVELPAWYNHITVPVTDQLLHDEQTRDWINAYVPGSNADPSGLPGDAVLHVLWAADVWYSIKKHWCLEAQRLIRAKRG